MNLNWLVFNAQKGNLSQFHYTWRNDHKTSQSWKCEKKKTFFHSLTFSHILRRKTLQKNMDTKSKNWGHQKIVKSCWTKWKGRNWETLKKGPFLFGRGRYSMNEVIHARKWSINNDKTIEKRPLWFIERTTISEKVKKLPRIYTKISPNTASTHFAK
jgi:hypothetical protein